MSYACKIVHADIKSEYENNVHMCNKCFIEKEVNQQVSQISSSILGIQKDQTSVICAQFDVLLSAFPVIL